MPDSPIQVEGDSGFAGLKSRLNPLAIPPGYLRVCENMRLDRGVAQVRPGAKRLADDISIPNVPVTLPFRLGINKPVVTLTRSGGTATATVTAHGYTTGDVVAISGADQAEYNVSAAITVTGADAFTFAVTGSPAILATGTIVANRGPVVRSSYAGGVFAAGVYSSPRVDNGSEYVVMVGNSGAFLWRDGAGVIAKSYPAGEIVQEGDEVSVLQAMDRLYIFRDRGEDEKAVSGITQAAGLATATVTAHGYATGDVVRIGGADQAGYNAEFSVTVTGANTFTFAVPADTVSPATSAAPLRLAATRVQAPMYWDGVSATSFVRSPVGTHPAGPTYSRLRSSAVVAYFNGQMVELVGKDEFAVSDILDPDTVDPLAKSFRVNFGSSDHAVGVHPFQGGNLIVFMRRSVYLASISVGADGGIDAAASGIELLTGEVGCAARRTVATAGDAVMFLSDSGVYRLDAGLELKLRGNSTPLSDDISDIIAGIDKAMIGRSNAVFWNNRYWLAVPMVMENGGSPTGPNAILIYNMLTQAWESVDRYGFDIDQFVVSKYGAGNRLYAANRSGRLFLLDEKDNGADDVVSGLGESVVRGRMVTRRFDWGSPYRKRFLRVLANVVVPAGGGLEVRGATVDPDASFQAGGMTNAGADEDYSLRYSVRRPCQYGEVEILTTGGRPVIRSLVAEGVLSASAPNMETRSGS